MMQTLIKYRLINIYRAMQARSDECSRQMVTFGIFGTIAFPTFGLLNLILLTEKHYDNFILRIVAGLFCLIMALKRFWPNYLKPFIPIYWYFLLIFCLPFFFFYMLLHNHFANVWLLNLLTVVFLTILMVDWISATIVFMLGAVLAVAVFISTSGMQFFYRPGSIPLSDFIAAFIITLVFGLLFSRNKQVAAQEKFKTIQSVGATIAHELRTPLASVSAQMAGFRRFLPVLLGSYQQVLKAGLPTEYIKPKQLANISRCADNIEAEIRASFHFIDMLLVSVKQPTSDVLVEKLSIQNIINEALSRYPFQPRQRDLVMVEGKADFDILADKILMIHVFFNLLKNALHFVMAKPGGCGKIVITVDKTAHQVHFKDTGVGIEAKALSYIFDRFYSNTHHGTGIGLAFCKAVMKGLRGDIVCRSVKNHFTEFILTFPQLQ